MTIRLLPPTLVNRIAAGEVVERPAAAVKELVENALDAGATKIDVVLTEGGKAALCVSDNGKGMSADELSLSVERHATSKLPTDDLFCINFFGFRGEALPSIASVSRMTLTSKTKEADTAWSLSVEGGQKGEPEPAAAAVGTKVEVRDLFYAVPARLKFLKSAQTETNYIADILKKLALAHPDVSFSLADEKKTRLNFKAVAENQKIERVRQVLGDEFADNSIQLTAKREGIRLNGYVGLPTLNKATSADQYFYVNGRPVRDKQLNGAVKAAYQGLLASDRFPSLLLFLDIPPTDVDVNVHPAKSEVRFRSPQTVRALVITAIRQALTEAGHKTSSSLATEALNAAETGAYPVSEPQPFPVFKRSYDYPNPVRAFPSRKLPKPPVAVNYGLFEQSETFSVSTPQYVESASLPPYANTGNEETFPPLGLARAQLHKTYIIAQTKDGIVIVDQHAAHERLTYEEINKNYQTGNAASQYLLIPEIVEVGNEKLNALIQKAPELQKTGLLLERFGEDTVLVRGIPAVLGETNVRNLITDLADSLLEWGEAVSLKDKIKDVCATMACHGSVRAGRKLDVSEMNALLRKMEAVPFSGQCIHGRPTYIELKLKDIEKLFGRRE